VLARSTGLAAQASARRSSELDLALLLAVEGHRLDDSVATRGGLLETVGQSPRLVDLHYEYGANIWSIDLSTDESTMAVRSGDGTLRLWDFRTRAPRTPPLPDLQGRGDVAFSPDGHLLVTTGEDGQIQLWDAVRGAPIRKWQGHRGVAASARFSRTGTAAVDRV
jgi:glucose/arabinose dehydrogenase